MSFEDEIPDEFIPLPPSNPPKNRSYLDFETISQNTLASSDSVQPLQSRLHSSQRFQKPSDTQRSLGNFHDYYLQVGMWPQLSQQKHEQISQKFVQLKHDYKQNKQEIAQLQVELNTPCGECERLLKEQKNTKEALQESVKLSQLLLARIHHSEKPQLSFK